MFSQNSLVGGDNVLSHPLLTCPCAPPRNVLSFSPMQRARLQLPRFGQGRSGQAMVEYIVCLAILVTLTGLLALLLVTIRENSGRVLDLVASDYP